MFHLRELKPGLILLAFTSALIGQTSVLTQHNDLARTGQNLSETILTPANVSSGTFGKAFSLNVDGQVFAQPLYVPNLTVNNSAHNVVFIATEHDSVFAFDADAGGAPLWQASMLDAAHGASPGTTTDPDADTACYVYVAAPEYGITGTPVIDPSTGTMYVVSRTFENDYPVVRLHALDITTGAEKFRGPAVITASVSGSGNGSSNGVLKFDPKWENQRAGLLLVDGNVYVAFGAYCDLGSFHGWLMAYDAATLAQTAVFLTTPNGEASGIWMGGAAPAVDVQNGNTRLFLTTGNGSYDATTPYATNTVDYGDDILRLNVTSNGLSVADAFTPLNQATLKVTDEDLGSSGALLLPDQPGAHPHLLVEASKGGVIYLVDRDNLGGYSTAANNVVQEIDGQAVSSFGLAAYWNGNVYLWPAVDHLKQFQLSNGLLSATPFAVSPQSTTNLNGLGSTPSISANGTTNAIVWTIDSSQSPQVVYAHDATNVATTLWSSAMNSSRDSAGPAIKFAVPTVANGKVYVGSNDQVMVYGLPDFSLSSTSLPPVTQGQTATASIAIMPQLGFSGTVALSASNLPAGVSTAFTSGSPGTPSMAAFSALASATPGSYEVLVTGVSGTLSHMTTLTVTVTLAPAFTLAASPASLTLTAGTSGITKVTVSPNETFAGSVAFTCSVASSLANVTCSVPGTVSGSGSVTLTVTAASNAAAPLWRKQVWPKAGFPGGYPALLFLLAGLFSLAAMRKARTVVLAASLLLMVVLASCHGGNSSSLSTGPAAETGLITVTGSSGSLASSATVSVTVQ